jgi:hypothetical protein
VRNHSGVEVAFYRGRGVPGNNHGRHQKRNGGRVNGDSSVVKLRFIGVCNGCSLMVEEGGPAPEGGVTMAARVRLRHSRDVAEPCSA